jgi:hypothetical protein
MNPFNSQFSPLKIRSSPLGGECLVYRFDNGFGASVVRNNYSYGGSEGLWELGVIRFVGEDFWDLVYDTPITDDVIGSQTEEEIADLLVQIAALPPL